ncbi:hypothetical protein GGX14DRAFT_544777 [Mycena pura]|uniref:Uncharacterized protein n=1 Tax=Mycena pura TaxID=153505 RepID=A0AAD6Y9X6_9AGAR|nr:hypothetical protein GGX14DRAFT_544777 [Mycena pura]
MRRVLTMPMLVILGLVLSDETGGRSAPVPTGFWVASHAVLVVTLLVSAGWMAAGIINKLEWIVAKWDPLGVCARMDRHGPALHCRLHLVESVVPSQIFEVRQRLVERHVSNKPWRRGEARWITTLRAALITCIRVGCGVILAGIYLLISLPVGSAPYTRTLVDCWQPPVSEGVRDPAGDECNLGFFNSDQQPINFANTEDATFTAFMENMEVTSNSKFGRAPCPASRPHGTFTWVHVVCNGGSSPLGYSPMSKSWDHINTDSANYSDGIFVGAARSDWESWERTASGFQRLQRQNPPPAMIRTGAALTAYPSWTARTVSGFISGLSLSTGNLILEREFRSLQVDNGIDANATTAIFTIINPKSRDVQDDTVFGGVSSLGGLWTSINGIFARLFGAEIAYFAFRNWQQDFPALRTEGGQPGSEQAGIVAFLRERMVDVDDDDRDGPAARPEKDESAIPLVAVLPHAPVELEDKSMEDKDDDGQSGSEARGEGRVVELHWSSGRDVTVPAASGVFSRHRSPIPAVMDWSSRIVQNISGVQKYAERIARRAHFDSLDSFLPIVPWTSHADTYSVSLTRRKPHYYYKTSDSMGERINSKSLGKLLRVAPDKCTKKTWGRLLRKRLVVRYKLRTPATRLHGVPADQSSSPVQYIQNSGLNIRPRSQITQVQAPSIDAQTTEVRAPNLRP